MSTSPRRPRVLVLARSYPSDLFPTLGLWTERPTVLLAERCEIRVVSPVPWCPALPNVGPFAQYARFRSMPANDVRHGVPIEHPRFLVGPASSLYRFEARAYAAGVRRTIDRMRARFPFDIVHAHFIYPDGAVARRLSERYGVPFVVTEHAPWTAQWFAHGAVRREALLAASEAAALLPVSSSVRTSMLAYGCDPGKIEIIPIGVDMSLFTLGAPENRVRDRILFVGWINFNKGVDVLLHAVAELEQRGTPGRATFVGGSYYRNTRLQESELMRLAESLNLGDRVSFTGHQPPQAVARLMAESAVVVLPSRAESFGAVLVEALAAGTPIVATRCGGPEDIVTPELGHLVPANDPSALADALNDVLSSPERYPADRLRSAAARRFAWEHVAGRIGDVYARVTDGTE